jgi:hypothetical protein
MTRPPDPERPPSARRPIAFGRPPLDDPEALDDWIDQFVATVHAAANAPDKNQDEDEDQ